MGGPTSSIVAEIFMLNFEALALSTADCTPKVWERHVDDCFLIIKEHYIQEFFDHINNLHPQIKFTIEKENNKTTNLFQFQYIGNLLIQTNTSTSIQIINKVQKKV